MACAATISITLDMREPRVLGSSVGPAQWLADTGCLEDLIALSDMTWVSLGGIDGRAQDASC